MFVLHSSSYCDVCLEGFNGTGDSAPHAIPCGHVFCKTCLEAVIPPRCPLCRKQYDPARLKKLHVDRPESFEDPKEVEYLQNIALLFDAAPDQLRIVEQEVDAWLADKAPEAAMAVRKARAAVDKYQNGRTREIEHMFTMRRLNEELASLRATMDEEKRRAHLVEENLLRVKDTLTIEVDRYKSELVSLRSEIERRTLKNPLPPPPEPVSFPRYPPFDPKFAHPNGPFWHSQPNYPSYIPPYPYGQPGQASIPRPINERENHPQPLQESNSDLRDRKGKSKDPLIRAPTSNGTTNASELEFPNAATPPTVKEANPHQGFFSRRSPPRLPAVTVLPEVTDMLKSGMDPFTLTAMLMPEYMNGYSEGFSSAVRPQEASSSQSSLVETDTLTSSSKSASTSERKKRREEREKEKEEERRERRRKRELEKERRQERERMAGEQQRRHEHRRERRASTATGRTPPTLDSSTPPTRTSSRPSTRSGTETNEEATRSPRRPSDGEANHRPLTQRLESHSEPLSDGQPPRTRRVSIAAAPALITPGGAPPVPPPVPPPAGHSPPARVVRLAAPTPRVPIQLTEPREESPDSGHDSPSRASIDTVSTWGTIDTSRSAHSNNSSLNIGEIHNFGRYARDHHWARPAATPYRPPALQLEPEGSSSEEGSETGEEDGDQDTPSDPNSVQSASTPTPNHAPLPPSTIASAPHVPTSWRPPSGLPPPETAPTRHRPQPRSVSTHPPPSTAPAHAHLGSRHTQTAYQNPTLQHQRPQTAAIPTGDGTSGFSAGPQGQDRRRGHGFSNSQPHTPSLRHPRSQQPSSNANAGVSVNGHGHNRARSGSSAGHHNVPITPHSSTNATHVRSNPRNARVTHRALDNQEQDSEGSDDSEESERHNTPAVNTLGLVTAPALPARQRNVSRHSNTMPIASPQGTHVNALGLALPPPQPSPIPISAPTPRPSNRQTEFLRTFSQS